MNRAEKERNREFRRLQFNHLGKQIIYLKKELESWRGLADVKPIEVKIAECEEERQKIMDEWGKGESMNEMASKFLKVMLSIVLFTIGLFLMIAAPFVFKETSSSTTSGWAIIGFIPIPLFFLSSPKFWGIIMFLCGIGFITIMIEVNKKKS